MMASMPQQFPGGGMSGHGGMPHVSHPMVSGHPSNQGIPGGQVGVSMGPQTHTGMAGGSGGPIMTGIPQGVGGPGASGPSPNAHALSHLNPTHPHLLQQQQQQQHQMQQASKYIKFPPSYIQSLTFNAFMLYHYQFQTGLMI